MVNFKLPQVSEWFPTERTLLKETSNIKSTSFFPLTWAKISPKFLLQEDPLSPEIAQCKNITVILEALGLHGWVLWSTSPFYGPRGKFMWLLVCFVFLLQMWSLIAQPPLGYYYTWRLNCLWLFQKSRSEESRGAWPVIDRRGSFWFNLAHDSEGSTALPSVVACSYGSLWKLPHTASFFPLPPRRILILVSSVFNSRVVSRISVNFKGLVSWRQVSWLFCFPHKTFYCAF